MCFKDEYRIFYVFKLKNLSIEKIFLKEAKSKKSERKFQISDLVKLTPEV